MPPPSVPGSTESQQVRKLQRQLEELDRHWEEKLEDERRQFDAVVTQLQKANSRPGSDSESATSSQIEDERRWQDTKRQRRKVQRQRQELEREMKQWREEQAQEEKQQREESRQQTDEMKDVFEQAFLAAAPRSSAE